MQKQLMTFDPSNLSAFGTLETNELTPVFQGDYVYGLNTQTWNTPIISGTGAIIDTNNSRLRLQSGTGTTNYAYITSKKIIRYRAGSGTIARFTPLYDTPITGNTQMWGVGTIINNLPVDGYFIGYSGATLGIMHYNNSVLSFIPQNSTTVQSWNGDKVDGSIGTSFNWNPTLGSPVMIKYPYLGFGDIFFYVQIPTTGAWTLIHTIKYANTTNVIELTNPSLQFIGYVANYGNIVNKTIYTASVGIFISGSRNFISNPKFGIDNNKATITTETCILNIKNSSSYNGTTNRGTIRLNQISVATATNNVVCTLKFKLNATIGGSTIYTPINGTSVDSGITITNGNSIASYDTGGTTISGGIYLYNLTIGAQGNANIDLTNIELLLSPGDILSVTASASASATVGVSVNWSEDI